jgi:hypothetical protein
VIGPDGSIADDQRRVMKLLPTNICSNPENCGAVVSGPFAELPGSDPLPPSLQDDTKITHKAKTGNLAITPITGDLGLFYSSEITLGVQK